MTDSLCVIPTCRIRNRHLGECGDEQCGGCLPRVADYGLTCDPCTDRTRDRLASIVDLAPDARLVAAGLVRRGGGSGGKPGSRSPINDAATDTLDEVQNILTTLARDIAETRGLQAPSAASEGRLVDPLVVAAKWLQGQAEWLRHATDGTQPWAPGAYGEIADCAGRMRGLVNGRSEQRFLGPCGAPTQCDISGLGEEPGSRTVDGAPCQGGVYCHLGADEGRCTACGAKWPTAKRQDWLDGEVRTHAFRASQIADAYGVNVDTIRTWASRPRADTGVPPLASYWKTEGGLVTPWTDTDDPDEIKARGPRLHYVGDVLDLAAADAARRATEQAKRARRAAAKAAEEASDAA